MGWEVLIPTVVVLSASGVLSPGPLTIVSISSGARYGKLAGVLVSTGHMLVEFPLVIAIAAGLTSVLQDKWAQTVIGGLGGAAVIGFGLVGIAQSLRGKDVGNPGMGAVRIKGGPLIAGLLFTGLNPFFITWWMTVGMALIADALALASVAGVFIMYASHIWMDFAWLTFLSVASDRALGLLGSKAIKYTELALSSVLLGMGVYLLFRVIQL
ncbi:MAG: LysE family translocator [Thaumarchaeota archaeon]|nr:LysE family translocator [Candidatus Calditenuaceae archaeon]MDW8186912.1 LysE family transporter [Nitrososphaerota archaeon]